MKLLLWPAAIVALALVLDRLLLRAEERGWFYWRRRKGSHGMAASALLEVQQQLEPSKKHVLEVRRERSPEAGEEGDPPTPGGHAPGTGGEEP